MKFKLNDIRAVRECLRLPGRRANFVKKMAAISLYDRLSRKAPVLTGRYRWGFNCSVNGIDYTVRPSAHIEVSADSHMLNLVAPVEVLTMDDVYALVDLARRLMKRETTVRELWPDYAYGREQWLAERELRDRDHALAAQLHNHA